MLYTLCLAGLGYVLCLCQVGLGPQPLLPNVGKTHTHRIKGHVDWGPLNINLANRWPVTC
jgi:hypothetical protein